MIKKLKAAYDAATPGNWAKGLTLETRHTLEPETVVMEIVNADGDFVACVNEPNDRWQTNAEFITLAHRAMPALLEAVELLKVAAHALETPGDFTPEEMQEQVIGDIGAFLAKLEGECDEDGAIGHMELKKLYALWDQLGDIPTNDADEIEEGFLHFDLGTHRESIWHWFEAQNPRFLVGEVINGQRQHLAKAQETASSQQVEIECWDSPRYGGDGLESSDVFVCEIDDRRAQSGQARITIGAESGDVDDFVDVLAEINTLPGSKDAVPCFHVAADSDHMAFSVFQNGLGKFLLRLETGMQLLPTTLETGDQCFVIQGDKKVFTG